MLGNMEIHTEQLCTLQFIHSLTHTKHILISLTTGLITTPIIASQCTLQIHTLCSSMILKKCQTEVMLVELSTLMMKAIQINDDDLQKNNKAGSEHASENDSRALEASENEVRAFRQISLGDNMN